jgi:hypothetical protein
MRRVLVVPLLVVVLLGSTVLSAAAITGGRPDGDDHPYVALLLVPGVTFCSGTLIDEDVVLTAGHCTWFWSNPGEGLDIDEVWVTFDSEAAVDENWMPIPGEGTWYVADTWATHPNYDDAAWPFTYDYGLVLLDEPVVGIEPADLPSLGQLDPIINANGQTSQRFNDVGYGQNGVTVGGGPPERNFDFTRKVSTQRYAPGNGSVSGIFHPSWFILGASPSPQHGSGCGGDSGSGIFPEGSDTIVAVHTGGYRLGFEGRLCGRITALNHRVDIPEVLNWLDQYID